MPTVEQQVLAADERVTSRANSAQLSGLPSAVGIHYQLDVTAEHLVTSTPHIVAAKPTRLKRCVCAE
jgi:hypothetical protein